MFCGLFARNTLLSKTVPTEKTARYCDYLLNNYTVLQLKKYETLVKNVKNESLETLRHIFAKPKDSVPTDQKTHVVYSAPCCDCEKICQRQRKRQFSTCLKQHQRVVSNSNSFRSAMAEQLCQTTGGPIQCVVSYRDQ